MKQKNKEKCVVEGWCHKDGKMVPIKRLEQTCLRKRDCPLIRDCLRCFKMKDID